MTQQQVAGAVGVSRGYIAAIERRRANPTVDVVDRISGTLGLEAMLVLRQPVIIGAAGQRDLVHGRCSAYVDRRLQAAGWQTAREVELIQARSHGWIDLLAFDLVTETLLIIEVKGALSDLGLVERQLAWYERSAYGCRAASRLATAKGRKLAHHLVERRGRTGTSTQQRSARASLSSESAGDARLAHFGAARAGWSWTRFDRSDQQATRLAHSVTHRRSTIPFQLCRLRCCRSTAGVLTTLPAMALPPGARTSQVPRDRSSRLQNLL